MVYEIDEVKRIEGAKEIMKTLINNLEGIVKKPSQKDFGKQFAETERRIVSTYELFSRLELLKDEELSEVYWARYQELRSKAYDIIGLKFKSEK